MTIQAIAKQKVANEGAFFPFIVIDGGEPQEVKAASDNMVSSNGYYREENALTVAIVAVRKLLRQKEG